MPVLSFGIAALTTVLFNLSLVAQEAAPRFEVATLKLSPPPAAASISIDLGTFQNGRFTFRQRHAERCGAVRLRISLRRNCWSDSTGATRCASTSRPSRRADTPPAQLRLMVRHLLEERLHLRHARRTANAPATSRWLSARSGSKLKAADRAADARRRSSAAGSITSGCRCACWRRSCLDSNSMLVVDRTGLEGFYEVRLEWAPERGARSTDTAAPPPDLPEPVRRRPGAARAPARRPARTARRRGDTGSLPGSRAELIREPGARRLEPGACLWATISVSTNHEKGRPLPNHG